MENLERKIIRVQKSTRTLIPGFSKVHNNLRVKFKWYYFWHMLPQSQAVHWAVLFLVVAIATGTVLGSLFSVPKTSLAATGVVRPDSGTDYTLLNDSSDATYSTVVYGGAGYGPWGSWTFDSTPVTTISQIDVIVRGRTDNSSNAGVYSTSTNLTGCGPGGAVVFTSYSFTNYTVLTCYGSWTQSDLDNLTVAISLGAYSAATIDVSEIGVVATFPDATYTVSHYRMRDDNYALNCTEPNCGWVAGEDVSATLTKNVIYRGRGAIYKDHAVENGKQFKVQWKKNAGGTWTDLGNTGDIQYTLSSKYADGDSITTALLTQQGSSTWINGKGVENNSTAAAVNFTPVGKEHTEYEWALKAVSAADPAATYYMRLTDLAGTWSSGEGTFTVVAGITVSGTVYNNDARSTNIGSGTNNVSISVNGGAKTTGNTDASGGFSFTGVGVNANEPIAVFLEGVSGNYGTMVTVANDSSTNITGLAMNTAKVVLRHETAGTLTNALLDTANNSGDANINYTNSGSDITFAQTYDVWIESGKTYNPGANAANINGSYKNSGTLTTSGTITFGATSGSRTIAGTLSGTSSFQNVTFNGVGGGWTWSAAPTINGALTLTNGTLNMSSYTTTVNGNVSLAGGTFNKDSSTVSLGGSSTQYITGGGKQFNHLTIANTTEQTASGFSVAGTLTVNASKTLTITNADVTMATGSTTTIADTGTVHSTGSLWSGGQFTLAGTAITNLSTTGTITADIQLNNATTGTKIPARTYGGEFQLWNNAGGSPSIILGTVAGQTLTFQSTLRMDAIAAFTLDGDTYDPIVNVSGYFALVTQGGVPTATSGSSAWTLASFQFARAATNSGGVFTAGGTVNVTDFVQSTDTTGVNLNMGPGIWTVGGNVNFTNITVTAGASTLKMTGNPRTLTGAGQTLNNVKIFDGASVSTPADSTGNFAANGTFTVGETAAATFSPGATSVISSGTGTLTGTGTAAVKTLGANAFLTQYTIANKTLTNLTVSYQGAGAQNVSYSGLTYGNLDVNMAGQIATLAGTTTVGNNLSITAGTLAGSTFTLNIGGNWSNSGTFTANTSTINFNAGATGKTLSGTMTGGSAFNNVIFNNAAGGWTFSAAATFGGDFTITAAHDLTLGAFTHNFSGNVTLGGTTLTSTGSTVVMNGATKTLTTNTQTLNNFTAKNTTISDQSLAISGTLALAGNLSVETTAAGGETLNCSSNPTVNITGNISYTKGTTGVPSISMGTGVWSVAGSVDFRNGTINNGNGTLKFTATSSGKNFYSNGQTLNNIDFDGVSGEWTLQDDLTAAGYLKITNGTPIITNRTLNIAGDFNRAGGNFTSTGSTVNLTGVGGSTQTISGSTTFNNLSATATAARTIKFTDGTTQTVNGTWTATGTSYNDKLITLTGTGAGGWTITPTAASVSYVDVSWSTRSGGTEFCASYSNNSGNNTSWKITYGAACVAPGTPTSFGGVAASTSRIDWSWNDNADNEDVIQIQDASNNNKSGNLTKNTLTWPETGLSVNTCQTRHAYFTNDFGNTVSTPDVTVCTWANAPGTPTVLVPADPADGDSLNIRLDKNGNPEGGGDADDTKYAVYNVDLTCWVNPSDGSCDGNEHWYTYQHGVTHWGGVNGEYEDSLDPDSQYTYQVKARNGDTVPVETGLSGTTDRYTRANIPGAPTLSLPAGLDDTDTLHAVVNKNGNPEGGGIAHDTQYVLHNVDLDCYVNPADGTCDDSPHFGTYTDWGKTSGKDNDSLAINSEYTYELSARNGDTVDTPYSGQANLYTRAKPPGLPNLAATSSSQIKLVVDKNGNPVGGGIADDTDYEIYNDDYSGGQYLQNDGTYAVGEDWQTYSTWGGAGGIENDADLLAIDSQYSLRVRARNGNDIATNWTDYVDHYTLAKVPNIAISIPAAEDDLDTLKMVVQQNDNPEGGGIAHDTDYAIYNATLDKWVGTDGIANKDDEVWAKYASLPTNWNGGSGVNNNSLSTNTQYTYQIKALNGDTIATNLSDGVNKYTRIEAVTGVDWNTQTTASVTLHSTNTPSNLGDDQSAIHLCNTTLAPDECSSWQGNVDPWTSNNGGANLAANTQYHFTVQSRNGDGVTTTAAAGDRYTLALPVTPPAIGEPAAGNYNETDGYLTGVGWGLNGATSVRVHRVAPSADVYTGSGISHDDKTLNANQTYTYRIYSRNGDTVENTAFVEVFDTTPPPRPENLDTIDISTNSAKSRWDETLANTSYEICYGTNSGGADNFVDGLGHGCPFDAGDTEFYNVADLASGTKYFYKVRADNLNGTGAWSNCPASGIDCNPLSYPYLSFTTNAAYKLLVRLPGQDFVDGSGITGDPDKQNAGSSFLAIVYAVDATNHFDNSKNGLTRITSSDDQANLPDDADLFHGIKSFAITLKTAGSRSVVASYVPGGLAPGSQLVTVDPAGISGADSYVTVNPTSLPVDNASTVSVYLRDAYNNALPGHSVSIQSSQSGDDISYYNQNTDAAGRAVGYVRSSSAHTSTLSFVIDGVTNLPFHPTITWTKEADVAPVARIVGPTRVAVDANTNFNGLGSTGAISRYEWTFSNVYYSKTDQQIFIQPESPGSSENQTVYAVENGQVVADKTKVPNPANDNISTNDPGVSEIQSEIKSPGQLKREAEEISKKQKHPIIRGYEKVKNVVRNALKELGTWAGNLFRRNSDKVKPFSWLSRALAVENRTGSETGYSFSSTGYYDVRLVVTDEAGRTDDEVQVVKVVPPAPVITRILRDGDQIIISGNSLPGVNINLFFAPGFVSGNVGRTRSNLLGQWTFTHPAKEFNVGEYKVYGIAIDDRNFDSDPSNEVVFKIDINGNVIVITPLPEETGINKYLTPKIANILKNISAVASTSAVALGLAAVALGVNFFNILPYLYYLLTLLAEKLGIKKKREPWGIVYNSVTKAPVELAIVRIFDVKSKKLLETRVTGKDGKFGFLARPGNYKISISKHGHRFASQLVKAGTEHDDVYTNLYHGSAFAITPEKRLTNYNIPVDPVAPQHEKTPGLGHKIMAMLMIGRTYIKKFIIPLLILAVVLAIITYIISGENIHLFVVAVCAILLSYELYDRKQKFNWGTVYDSATKKPIDGAIIKIYDEEFHQLKEAKGTDERGQFGFLVPAGKYTIEVEKTGYVFPSKTVNHRNDGSFHDIYHGETFEKKLSDNVVSVNIPLDPKD